MNIKKLNEYFEPYYDRWDKLIIPYEYLEIGKYYTPTDSYFAYKFIGEKNDELIFENKKGEEKLCICVNKTVFSNDAEFFVIVCKS